MALSLSRHRRIIIDLAVRILRTAIARSAQAKVDTIEVGSCCGPQHDIAARRLA